MRVASQSPTPTTSSEVRLSEIISSLSLALDLTEGQPPGHAARSCMIGMELGRALQLPPDQMSALFYALLMKDLGCSSNAAKMTYLFGADDRILKRDVKTVNWQKLWANLKYARQHVLPDGRSLERLMRLFSLAAQGPAGPRALIKIRCERGAQIVRKLGFSELTAQAILDLDEHWNGKGHPRGLRREEISLLGRILSISQTAEVFWTEQGLAATLEVLLARSGKWFDPNLVKLFNVLARNESFQGRVRVTDPNNAVNEWEPVDGRFLATPERVDLITEAFADVVDAKSPWTYRHSSRVAEIAVGMGRSLGFDGNRLRTLRRAALLHDIGKLGVSNLILDKPGKLNDAEFAEIKRHPQLSEQILGRIELFKELAGPAGQHHERFDGKGYFRGIPSKDLGIESRLLMVADVFEALTAKRPYRDPMPTEKVMEILQGDVGTGVCPQAFETLESWLESVSFESRIDAQLDAVASLEEELFGNCSSCHAREM